MFKSRNKIELNDDELRIMRYSLIDFRNTLLKENKYADLVNEIMCKLNNKMKVDKYDLGIMINGLDKKRKIMLNENQNTTVINDLLLKLIKIHKTL